MTNAVRFIDLLCKLYNLTDKQRQQMENNIPEIDEEFKGYEWDDIREKVNLYYARKNDKTRPAIAQILAMLESDSAVVRSVVAPVPAVLSYSRPTTKLFTISSTFDRLIDILIDGGVLPDSDGSFHNDKSLVDPDTNEVILQPIAWLVAKTNVAMMERPECFVSYQFASPLERVAVALQNRLITFGLRNWSKLVQQQKIGGTL